MQSCLRRRSRSSNAVRGTIPPRERRRSVARTDRSGCAESTGHRPAPQERGKTRAERPLNRMCFRAPIRNRRMDPAAASEAGARERAMQSHESCRFSGPRPADAAYGGIQSGVEPPHDPVARAAAGCSPDRQVRVRRGSVRPSSAGATGKELTIGGPCSAPIQGCTERQLGTAIFSRGHWLCRVSLASSRVLGTAPSPPPLRGSARPFVSRHPGLSARATCRVRRRGRVWAPTFKRVLAGGFAGVLGR